MSASARLALAGLVAAMAAQAVAAPPRAATLEAVEPWSRPAAAGTTGAGFLTLVNRGRTADALVGARTPAAQRVEMHASSMAGGVMRMTPETRVALPAGGRVTFAPGGRHLMLVGLKTALKPGDHVPATLEFASGARLEVDFKVGSGLGPPEAAPMTMPMDHHH